MSKSKPRYFSLERDHRRHTLGFKIVNLDALQANGKGLMAEPPWKEGADLLDPNGGPWRIPNFLETPRIVYDVKFKRAPRDSEGGDNAWIVSAKLKAIVERLAPHGSVFRACETFWSSGEPGPERWLCAIVQVFSGVVDDDLSENLTPCVFPNGQSAYLITPLSKVILRTEFLRNSHVFRVIELPLMAIYCDNLFLLECKRAKITGLTFHDLASERL
jgi:hypothetical protein